MVHDTADEPFEGRPPYTHSGSPFLLNPTRPVVQEPIPDPIHTKPRRPLRPLHGIPDRDPRGKQGLVVSFLVHAVIVLMLVLPTLVARQLDIPMTGGGGGAGPAGGGGGGTGGTGGTEVRPERLRYMQVAPIPVAPPTTETPAVVPTVVPPVIPPPVVEKPPEIVPPAPPVTTVPEPSAVSVGTKIPTAGVGGGTGNDGSGGTGPGTGGGVGSGVGTGRGSGTGAGTGGGPGDIYPPQVTNLAILPIPVPSKVRPYKMVAYFEVDERGNAKLLQFNPSSDAAYNRKIRLMLAEVRFRPAVRQDGTPVRDTTWITAEAP